MDITRVQRKGKKRLEQGLGKQSQDKHIGDLERNSFSEADYNDPLVKQWCEEVDQKFQEKFGRITHEELFKIQDLVTKIRKENPLLKFNEAVDIVLEQISFQKKC